MEINTNSINGTSANSQFVAVDESGNPEEAIIDSGIVAGESTDSLRVIESSTSTSERKLDERTTAEQEVEQLRQKMINLQNQVDELQKQQTQLKEQSEKQKSDSKVAKDNVENEIPHKRCERKHCHHHGHRHGGYRHHHGHRHGGYRHHHGHRHGGHRCHRHHKTDL